ncbi:hypothetical protein MH928_04480 [Flavobacterium sp. WW92]|uniref:hypothetical protein n=1 Tax=unclassified Flavobacterium TaxID=196869 RepID=UPI002224A890|nr:MULTISPECIES: hypothetical protein [unclassified Flavobacterium]WDO13959.1 hypothetical protein MH928_04480 [Flavobacterium sp. WW92]
MNITEKIKPIHPFAARMAPEIALQALDGLPKGSLILDPMTGSGTVLRTISEMGYNGLGLDIDPLSVLMSKAWTTKICEETFLKEAHNILNKSIGIQLENISLPWIDEDLNTQKFINFWFASEQIKALRGLSFFINQNKTLYSSLFKIALSKLIITKSKGASLAADVSHSRPHRVRVTNDFDVFREFERVCLNLSKTIFAQKLTGEVNIRLGDARRLSSVKKASIDCIITSPPYLNALDYMRGHKLSLVWLGHSINDLALIRGNSVGAEKAPNTSNIVIAKDVTKKMEEIQNLPQNKINMIYRYALDMNNILKETSRVLKDNGKATFVIGNSSLKGIYIKNTLIAEESAKRHGLQLIEKQEREIPQNKRYLPPPSNLNNSAFNLRMRTESVITFKKVL